MSDISSPSPAPKKKMSTGKKVLIGVGALIVVIAIAAAKGGGKKRAPSLFNPSESTASTQPLEPAISSRDLVQAYIDNEVGADQKYKKEIVVAGLIADIKKDIMDKAYILLPGSDGMRSVQCFFDDESSKILGICNQGDYIVIRGKGKGLMMNVLVKDCSVMEWQTMGTTSAEAVYDEAWEANNNPEPAYKKFQEKETYGFGEAIRRLQHSRKEKEFETATKEEIDLFERKFNNMSHDLKGAPGRLDWIKKEHEKKLTEISSVR